MTENDWISKILFVGGPLHGRMKDRLGDLHETFKIGCDGRPTRNAVYALKRLENHSKERGVLYGEEIYLFNGYEDLSPSAGQ